jgi:hypothetical protein
MKSDLRFELRVARPLRGSKSLDPLGRGPRRAFVRKTAKLNPKSPRSPGRSFLSEFGLHGPAGLPRAKNTCAAGPLNSVREIKLIKQTSTQRATHAFTRSRTFATGGGQISGRLRSHGPPGLPRGDFFSTVEFRSALAAASFEIPFAYQPRGLVRAPRSRICFPRQLDRGAVKSLAPFERDRRLGRKKPAHVNRGFSFFRGIQ